MSFSEISICVKLYTFVPTVIVHSRINLQGGCFTSK